MAASPAISVVVACYNEQEVLPELHRRISAVCASLDRTYEIVLVDDGSKDATWSIMQQAAAADSHIVAAKLSRNHGHQLCLTAGLTICRGERIFIIDADLQDPPELLPAMMKVMDEGYDVVYGQRRTRHGDSFPKRIACAIFYRLLAGLTEIRIPLDAGDFRLISRRTADVLNNMPERHRFLRGMVSWVGFRQIAFPYDREPRLAGKTKYPLRRLLRLALDGVTAFSVRPLALASYVSAISAAIGLSLLAYSICGWWFGGTPHGWTSLIAAIVILGSLQLLFLGIIGEYLGRLYEQSKGRPLFIVEEIARSTDQQPPGK